MLDIKFVRENPDAVRENIRKKFQDGKLPLVDKVLELDKRNREIKTEVESLRAKRKTVSKEIGKLMGQGKKDEAERIKAEMAGDAARIDELSAEEVRVEEELLKTMMVIPNIIDPSVPIGKNDTENVELERFGEPVVPDFEIPYHTDIMESFCGIDLDSARRVAGNGFYYLMGDMARLHSGILAYARDFMVGRGFTYCVPPFMIRSNVVSGVMSFAEMDSMMYKIEGEDLYLIGTSEHSMIGRFIDQILPEESLPLALTSYSPCFRKEKACIIHRVGFERAQLVKEEAKGLLKEIPGHPSTCSGTAGNDIVMAVPGTHVMADWIGHLKDMCVRYAAEGISPGGAADMLALTVFIESIIN